MSDGIDNVRAFLALFDRLSDNLHNQHDVIAHCALGPLDNDPKRLTSSDIRAVLARLDAVTAERDAARSDRKCKQFQRNDAYAILADAACAFAAGDMERVRLDLCDRYVLSRAYRVNREVQDRLAQLEAERDAARAALRECMAHYDRNRRGPMGTTHVARWRAALGDDA